MPVIVETGDGVPFANSYVSTALASFYLRQRNRNSAFDAASVAGQEAAVIAATDYIDRRWGLRFLGRRQYLSMDRVAGGFLQFTANPTNNDTVTIGTTVYTFKAVIADPFDVLIGAAATNSRDNLIAAITLGTGAGSLYGTGTTEHPDVTASSTLAGTTLAGDTMIVLAKVVGETGNSIVTTTSDEANLVWSAPTLVDGRTNLQQPLEFPRLFLRDRTGSLITGIPDRLREATIEYADRALSATLMPDPTVDDTGRAVLEKMEKVGPIEERTRYADGSAISQLIRPYPAADRLLSEYVRSGGVIRG